MYHFPLNEVNNNTSSDNLEIYAYYYVYVLANYEFSINTLLILLLLFRLAEIQLKSTLLLTRRLPSIEWSLVSYWTAHLQ